MKLTQEQYEQYLLRCHYMMIEPFSKEELEEMMEEKNENKKD